MPPKFVSCYLCGQQYGLSSLPIHQQSCYKKRITEWEQRPKATRGPPPTHPSQVPNHGIAPTQKQNTQQGTSSATSIAQPAVVGGLVPCEYCGRTFNGDRIEKHQEACKKSQNSKRSKFNSSKQRIKGTELENMTIPSTEPDSSSNPIDWKSQRRDFLSNIRVAKKTQDFEHEFEVYVPSSKPQTPSINQNDKIRNDTPTQGKRPAYHNTPKNDSYYDNADTSSNGLSSAPSVGSSAYRSSSSVAQYTLKPRQSTQDNETKRNPPTQPNDQIEFETRPNRPPATRRPDPTRVDERQERQPNKVQPPAARRSSRERIPQDDYRPISYETAQREPVRDRYERNDRSERNERNERKYTQRYYEEPEQEEVDEEEDEEFINSDPYTAKLYAEYLASKRSRQVSYQPNRNMDRGTKSQGYPYTNTRPVGRSENRDYDDNSDSRPSYNRRPVGEPRRMDPRDDYRGKPISRNGRDYDEPRHDRSYHEDEDDDWEDGSLSHRSYSSHSSQYRSGSIHSDSRSYGGSSARRKEPQEVRDNYYYRR